MLKTIIEFDEFIANSRQRDSQKILLLRMGLIENDYCAFNVGTLISLN